MPNPAGTGAGPYVAASAVLVTGVLAVRAWQADLAVPGATAGRAALDVGVGVGLACAALLLRSHPVRAVFVGLTAATWLLGSVYALGTLHQGFLILALATTTASRPWSRRSLTAAAAAAVCAWGGGGQLVSGTLCVVVAALVATGAGRGRERALTAAGGIVLGVVLLASWALERFAWARIDPQALPITHDLAVVAVAGCLVAASRGSGDPAWRVRRGLLAPVPPGQDRRQVLVEDLLRTALRDPDLSLVLHGPGEPPVEGRPVHVVRAESGEEVAVVLSSSPLLEDAGVAAAVAEAVRPVAASARLQHEQEHQLEELRRSRTRLIAAVDDERAAIVELLRSDALRRLDEVIEALAPLTGAGAVSADVETALEQLARARADVLAVAQGAPPADLGDGAIEHAVRALAEASPLDVDVMVDGSVAAERSIEAAAFYVCSEALTNAARHSGAGRVRVSLSEQGGSLVLEVSDEGRGGADPSGSGLRGLADRVEAAGGSLTVTSPELGGTTVVARLGGVSPRSAATA